MNSTLAVRFAVPLVAILAALAAPNVSAQGNWPTKPVTLVVPFAAGGPTDVVARTLAASMGSKSLGQTVVVENKLGAGGTVAAASWPAPSPTATPSSSTTTAWRPPPRCTASSPTTR